MFYTCSLKLVYIYNTIDIRYRYRLVFVARLKKGLLSLDLFYINYFLVCTTAHIV